MSDNSPLSLLASLHTITGKTENRYYFALNSTSFPSTAPTPVSVVSLPSTPPHTLIKGKNNVLATCLLNIEEFFSLCIS